MSHFLRRTLRISALLAAPLFAGCWDDGAAPPAIAPPPGPAPNGPMMSGPGGPGGGPGSNPVIKEAMVKVGKGPTSLVPTINKELKEASPPWDAIGPQAHEVAALAASIVKEEPTRGDKESWARLTGTFVATADELEKAAQSKDRDAATKAHAKLANGCMECHRAHRAMGPGGPGGGPGRGGPAAAAGSRASGRHRAGRLASALRRAALRRADLRRTAPLLARVRRRSKPVADPIGTKAAPSPPSHVHRYCGAVSHAMPDG